MRGLARWQAGAVLAELARQPGGISPQETIEKGTFVRIAGVKKQTGAHKFLILRKQRSARNYPRPCWFAHARLLHPCLLPMTDTRISWHDYLNRRMLICVFLGFTSGLPLFILLSLLQAWLAKSGLNIKALGLFALLMFPYTRKFVWSPLMDRFHFGRMGCRRGWMFLTQVGLFFSIGGMGMLDPATQLGMIAFVASLVAF